MYKSKTCECLVCANDEERLSLDKEPRKALPSLCPGVDLIDGSLGGRGEASCPKRIAFLASCPFPNIGVLGKC